MMGRDPEFPAFYTAAKIKAMWFSITHLWRGGYNEQQVDKAMDIVEKTLHAYENFTTRVRSTTVEGRSGMTMYSDLQIALRNLEQDLRKDSL